MKGRERNSKFFEQAGVTATNKQKSSSIAQKNYLRAARETGSASMSNRNLSEFPIDLCYYEDKIDPDEKYWETLPLVKIDLSHNNISIIPSDIGRLTDLTSLRLRNNSISIIDREGLSKCNQIKSLDLSSNSLNSLEDSLGPMVDLKEILVGSNQLTSLPKIIVNYPTLQILDVQDNKICALPINIHKLHGLLKLNISQNLISELPASLSEMRALTSLEVRRNGLKRLPNLSQLSSLTYLDASENQLDSFPTLPSCGVLARLYLGCNRIPSIEMSSLQPIMLCLTELQLNDNTIETLPLEIGYLAVCRVLDLCNKNLSDIPHTLGYMNGLQKLVVDGNPIRCIRRNLLTQSTMDLKKYLRTRGDPLPNQVLLTNSNPHLPTVDAIDMGSNKGYEMI
jgi:Leucine-rich repeat (LRR) protein